MITRNAALLIVDVQIDFCPGGALPVPNGDRVIAPINRLIERFTGKALPVFASRDWHPPQSRHFAAFGGEWPVHCVRDSPGAAFNPGLLLTEKTVILSKGLDPEQNGYSAFEALTADDELLDSLLKRLNVQHLYVCGLATEYCVRSTVMDALARGYTVTVLAGAIAGINAVPGACAQALEEMVTAGAHVESVDGLLGTMRALGNCC